MKQQKKIVLAAIVALSGALFLVSPVCAGKAGRDCYLASSVFVQGLLPEVSPSPSVKPSPSVEQPTAIPQVLGESADDDSLVFPVGVIIGFVVVVVWIVCRVLKRKKKKG